MNGLFLKTEEESIKALATGYPWPAEMVMAAYNVAMTNAKPSPIIVPSSPLVIAGPLNQTLQDKAKAFYVQAIRATPTNFDRTWDSAITDWLTTGGEAIRKERAEKYAAP